MREFASSPVIKPVRFGQPARRRRKDTRPPMLSEPLTSDSVTLSLTILRQTEGHIDRPLRNARVVSNYRLKRFGDDDPRGTLFARSDRGDPTGRATINTSHERRVEAHSAGTGFCSLFSREASRLSAIQSSRV